MRRRHHQTEKDKAVSKTRVSFDTTEDDAPLFIKTVGLERTTSSVSIFATNKRGDDYINLEIPINKFIGALKSLGLSR